MPCKSRITFYSSFFWLFCKSAYITWAALQLQTAACTSRQPGFTFCAVQYGFTVAAGPGQQAKVRYALTGFHVKQRQRLSAFLSATKHQQADLYSKTETNAKLKGCEGFILFLQRFKKLNSWQFVWTVNVKLSCTVCSVCSKWQQSLKGLGFWECNAFSTITEEA